MTAKINNPETVIAADSCEFLRQYLEHKVCDFILYQYFNNLEILYKQNSRFSPRLLQIRPVCLLEI